MGLEPRHAFQNNVRRKGHSVNVKQYTQRYLTRIQNNVCALCMVVKWILVIISVLDSNLWLYPCKFYNTQHVERSDEHLNLQDRLEMKNLRSCDSMLQIVMMLKVCLSHVKCRLALFAFILKQLIENNYSKQKAITLNVKTILLLTKFFDSCTKPSFAVEYIEDLILISICLEVPFKQQ